MEQDQDQDQGYLVQQYGNDGWDTIGQFPARYQQVACKFALTAAQNDDAAVRVVAIPSNRVLTLAEIRRNASIENLSRGAD